jgi:hypothetical protein
MIFAHVAATVSLLIVSSIGPGLLFVRYLRWRPMETLCGSVALSFFLLYLTTFAIYILGLPPAWAYVPTAGAMAANVVCGRDLRRLWRSRETRATMLAFLAILSWLLLLLLVPRGYSGGRWYGDWFEHFHRAGFFSDHLPLDTKFLDVFILPARPPMMNLLATSMFWQVTTSFEVFQITFSYLNALAFLPCALIAPSLVARTRNRAWLIAGLLAISPMFVQNSTYTWTKLFAAFYELTALGFYLSAWRRNDASRMVAAFACFAMGMLIHYSVAPMVMFVTGHYLFVLFRRRKNRWQELVVSAAVVVAIFGTWLTWSLYSYGLKDTFASNTTVISSQQFSLSNNLWKIAENIFNTLVPAVMRGGIEHDFAFKADAPPVGQAYLRDWCFAVYQPSFPAVFGLGGLALLGWLLVQHYIHPARDPWQHRRVFWLSLNVVVTVIGVAVVGETDYLGVTHICLQPLVLLGMTFAAVGLPHVPRWFRKIVLVGLLIDATLGILLHFYILRNNLEVTRIGDQVSVAHSELGSMAIQNALLKSDHFVTFLGDHAANFAGYTLAALIVGVLGICLTLWLVSNYPQAQTMPSIPIRPHKSSRGKRKRRR